MSPDEIKSFVKSIDWQTVLSGQTPFPRAELPPKGDKIAFRTGWSSASAGTYVAGGLNSGAAVGLLFDRAMLPYWDIKNFDELPIPFRCVATELNTGQAHIFDHGSLAQALRATMSIPGIFAPCITRTTSTPMAVRSTIFPWMWHATWARRLLSRRI